MKKILSLALLSVISASATTKVLSPINPSLSKTWSNESDISRSIRSLKEEVKNPEYTNIELAEIAINFAEYDLTKSEIRKTFSAIAKKTSRKTNPKSLDAAVAEAARELVKITTGKVTKNDLGTVEELIHNLIAVASELNAAKEEAAKAGSKSTLETELRQALREMIGTKEAREFMRTLTLLQRNSFVNAEPSQNIIAESLYEYREKAEEIESIELGLDQLFKQYPDLDSAPKEHLSGLQKTLTDELLETENNALPKIMLDIKYAEEEIVSIEDSLPKFYCAVQQIELILQNPALDIARRQELVGEYEQRHVDLTDVKKERKQNEKKLDQLMTQRDTLQTRAQKINNQIKALKKILK